MHARHTKLFAHAIVLAGFGVFLAEPAHAEQVTFSFSGSITSVSPAAPGFPASLSDLSVGDPVSYLLTVEVPAAAEPNPFGSPYDTASYYNITDFSFQADVDGAPLTLPGSPSDRLFAFVWDGDFSGLRDGFTLNNTSAGFLLNTGNLAGLAPSTFADESFPIATIAGGIVFQASRDFSSQVWFVAQGTNLTLVQAPVPEPSTWAIVAAGMLLVGWAARRRCAGAHRVLAVASCHA